MKKYIVLNIAVLLCAFATINVAAQCNSDDLVNGVVSSLPVGYNFLKSYKIEGEPDLEKIEFSYVLTRGTQYTFILKDRNPSLGTVVTLFDTKRNRVASNKIGNETVSAVAFPCNATGIYYIQYTFLPGSARCGGSVLGFKR